MPTYSAAHKAILTIFCHFLSFFVDVQTSLFPLAQTVLFLIFYWLFSPIIFQYQKIVNKNGNERDMDNTTPLIGGDELP